MWNASISLAFSLIMLFVSSASAQGWTKNVSAQNMKSTTVFVAPDGDDANPGTMDLPLASLQKAQEMVSAGDTVYVRGGTYLFTDDDISRVVRNLFASITYLDKSGTEGNTIKYWAYPGETPVFDFSDVRPPDRRVVGIYVVGSYLHIKGLEMTGVQTTITDHTESYCVYSRGNNNVFEQLVMHDNVGTGLRHYGGGGNLFLNCDAYRNWDSFSEQGIGDNNDGFGIHPDEGSELNVVRGCRAWFNSDDGFDIIRAGSSVLIDSSWAFYNGYSSSFQSLGDGNGFKAGGHAHDTEDRLPSTIPRHTIRFSVAVRNKANGFYSNHHLGGNDWYNNSGYLNGSRDFNMLNRPSRGDANNIDGPGYDHVLKNNLAFAQFGDGTANIVDSLNTQEANTWTLGIRVAADDFLSMDIDQLTAPRQQDGSLPAIEFLRPAPGSEIIDAGVEIGFEFVGDAPDLGAFEAPIATGLDDFNQTLPAKTLLFSNYPNPFNSVASIRYSLAQPAHVNLSIYNVMGQKVRTLVDRHQNTGSFAVQWKGQDDAARTVASGMYIYQLTTVDRSGTQVLHNTMLFLK